MSRGDIQIDFFGRPENFRAIEQHLLTSGHPMKAVTGTKKCFCFGRLKPLLTNPLKVRLFFFWGRAVEGNKVVAGASSNRSPAGQGDGYLPSWQGQRPPAVSYNLVEEEQERQLDRVFDDMEAKARSILVDPTLAPESLKATLYPHQLQGLSWMLKMERQANSSSSLPPLWRSTPNGYKHDISGVYQMHKPNAVKGGILSDDMGLGKTIQVLATILANPPKGKAYEPRQRPLIDFFDDDNSDSDLGSDEIYEMDRDELDFNGREESSGTDSDFEVEPARKKIKGNERSSKETGTTPAPVGTLIVCPASVMHNWESQCKEHVEKRTLNVLLYHGCDRDRNSRHLARYDIVVTTYGTLVSEMEKHSQAKGKGIAGVLWRRVVLDEAHLIRNQKSKTFLSAMKLEADLRWCLTGTPIQNTANDAHALIRFLGIEPFQKSGGNWAETIGGPIKDGNSIGFSRLRTLLQSFCLRRRKVRSIKLTLLCFAF